MRKARENAPAPFFAVCQAIVEERKKEKTLKVLGTPA
jgi:hypothetical protein